MNIYKRITGVMAILLVSLWLFPATALAAPPPQNPQSGSVGLQGQISAPPPTIAATISIPRDGQSFTSLPVTVSGLCPNDLLIKVFKNNVFAGSVQCKGGSYSLVIDLFSGQNELIARDYDALDQVGPDSNKVTVAYNDSRPGAGTRVSLTSNFAKRGANTGQALTWPIILSGGEGPYAISVDWGDGKAPDLISQQFPGTFNIQHTYDSPGVYNIIVKVSDKNGGVAYLQLVGVGNGPLSQDQIAAAKNNGQNGSGTTPKTKILWQPAAILIPFILSTFWLGKKYELKMLKKKIERGDRPF
jgi:hypothetical protein